MPDDVTAKDSSGSDTGEATQSDRHAHTPDPVGPARGVLMDAGTGTHVQRIQHQSTQVSPVNARRPALIRPPGQAAPQPHRTHGLRLSSSLISTNADQIKPPHRQPHPQPPSPPALDPTPAITPPSLPQPQQHSEVAAALSILATILERQQATIERRESGQLEPAEPPRPPAAAYHSGTQTTTADQSSGTQTDRKHIKGVLPSADRTVLWAARVNLLMLHAPTAAYASALHKNERRRCRPGGYLSCCSRGFSPQPNIIFSVE